MKNCTIILFIAIIIAYIIYAYPILNTNSYHHEKENSKVEFVDDPRLIPLLR